MDEPHLYIYKALKLIEKKVGWGDSSEWTNSYFELLSEQIQESTGILISVLTLKRLFGKVPINKEKYNPQISTKNAIAKYLGYKNWTEFLQLHTESKPAEAKGINLSVAGNKTTGLSEEDVPILDRKVSNYKFYFNPVNIGIVLCTVIAVVTVAVINNTRNKVQFEGKDLVGQVPLYSAFHYDVTHSGYKDFMIEGDMVQSIVPKEKHYHTLIFNVPTFHKVKLLAEGKELASVNVHALSPGWVAVYQNSQTSHLLPENALEKTNGRLYISPRIVAENGFDIGKEYWIAYKNIKDFPLSGDNFCLETRIKNNPLEGGVSCFDAVIEIIGEHSKANVVFVKPGCTKYAKVEFGEISLNGVFHQLNAYGKDLQDWRKISMEVDNKEVKVFFEDELINQFSYKKEVGDIKGICLVFKGTGAVDYVKLFDKGNKIVYNEGFGD